MKVKKSSLDDVKARFELKKQQKEQEKREYDFQERMGEIQEEVSQLNTPFLKIIFQFQSAITLFYSTCWFCSYSKMVFVYLYQVLKLDNINLSENFFRNKNMPRTGRKSVKERKRENVVKMMMKQPALKWILPLLL